MENIKILEVENPLTKAIQKFVIIDRGNEEYTSMLKSEYDELQAANPIGGNNE
jgi:hypothetical protein